MDPKGKCAVVTGAASGLGLAITRELLTNGLQAVIMADINEDLGEEVCKSLDKEFPASNVMFHHMDVTKEEEFEAAFKTAISVFGQVDIVVNNAGILDDKDYEKEVRVNVGGVIRGTLLGLKYMGKDKLGKGGIIVNMSSGSAVISWIAGPIYGATKAAVLSLSRTFGTPFHYERTGVRVVTMCPALTETPILSKSLILDECKPAMKTYLEGNTFQKAEIVGLAAIYIIKHAESASAWLVASNKLYKLDTPSLEDISTFIEGYSQKASSL